MQKTTSIIQATRYHDFCAGHRVVGHENKCRHLHGHNYRVTFHCQAEVLDSVGRVMDFSVIKERLCEWLEENWDHKFLYWEKDELMKNLDLVQKDYLSLHTYIEDLDSYESSLVKVPFNPTAENMAQHLVEVIGPQQLAGTNVILSKVIIEETRKCSASFSL